MITWKQRVTNLRKALGRDPTTEELLTASEMHIHTPEEIKSQAQSFARAMKLTGDPRFD